MLVRWTPQQCGGIRASCLLGRLCRMRALTNASLRCERYAWLTTFVQPPSTPVPHHTPRREPASLSENPSTDSSDGSSFIPAALWRLRPSPPASIPARCSRYDISPPTVSGPILPCAALPNPSIHATRRATARLHHASQHGLPSGPTLRDAPDEPTIRHASNTRPGRRHGYSSCRGSTALLSIHDRSGSWLGSRSSWRVQDRRPKATGLTTVPVRPTHYSFAAHSPAAAWCSSETDEHNHSKPAANDATPSPTSRCTCFAASFFNATSAASTKCCNP